MTSDQWRALGRLEALYDADQNNADAAVNLAEYLIGLPEAWGTLPPFLEELKKKFPTSFRVFEIAARFASVQGDKKAHEDATKLALELAVVNTQDLRRKLILLRDINMPEKAQKELDDFEAKLGKSVETVWMRGDLFATLANEEGVKNQIAELDKLPESPMREIAKASLLLALNNNKEENWKRSQNLLVGVLQKDPNNLLAYRVFFVGASKTQPMQEAFDKLVQLALDNNLPQAFVLIEAARLKLEYLIPMHNEKMFARILELLPKNEQPILKVIHVLCCYFDNIGLARSIMRAWLDPNQDGPNLSVFVSQVAMDLANATETGMGLVQNGKMKPDELKTFLHQAAIEAMERLIEQAPNNSEAYYQMGFLLLAMKDHRAYQYFIKSLELRPDNIYAQLQVAKMKDDEGQDIEAYERYRKIAISPVTDPTVSVEAMISASEIAIKYGWIEEGEDLLEKARMVMPSDPRVVTMLAKVYLKEAKIIGSDFALEQSQKYFTQALMLNPSNSEASYYLGHVFYNKHEYLEAIRQFKETSDRFKDSSILCSFWISRSYHQLFTNLLFSSTDFLTSAIKYAEHLRVLGENVPEALEYLAELYQEAGRHKESQTLLTAARARIKYKDFKPILPAAPGEANVLAVYAPQVIRGPDPNKAPERLFSKGSLGTIEISYIHGGGGLLVTGNLGESFQNSIEVAYAFFKRYLQSFGLMQDPTMDIHVDVPGWLPKYDGPSAGTAIACAMISAFTDKPMPKNITMTGEISMHGRVMPVGGIKEKVEATFDKGIDKIYIPKDNKWDYLDMLLKDSSQDTTSVKEKAIAESKTPTVVAVEFITQVVDDLGIGIDQSMIPKDEPEEEPPKEEPPKQEGQ